MNNKLRLLNELEIAALQSIKSKYPILEAHMLCLYVQDVENTGVGMYVNLGYDFSCNDVLNIEPVNATLGSNQIFQLNNLQNGLGFVVEAINGRLKYIEFFTYGGEMWDGKYENFLLEDI